MDGPLRSARSPPGGVQARTGMSGESCTRARPAAYLSACRLPGDPLTPANTLRTRDTVRLLPDGSYSSSKPLPGSELAAGTAGSRASGIHARQVRISAKSGGCSAAGAALIIRRVPAGWLPHPEPAGAPTATASPAHPPEPGTQSHRLDSNSQIYLTFNSKRLLKEGDSHDQLGKPPVVGTGRPVPQRSRCRP